MAQRSTRTRERPERPVSSGAGLGLACALLLAACPPPGPGVPARPLVGVQLRCEPPDALIYVDDQYQGSAAALASRPLMLPEGMHRIEIRRDGYFPHFVELTASKGVQQRLDVKLRKEPY